MKHPLPSLRPASPAFPWRSSIGLVVLALHLGSGGFGLTGMAAEPPAAPTTPATPAIVSLMGRILSVDVAKNRFAVSNKNTVYQLRCLPTTLVKRDGPVVKITDLQVGADVMVRGKPEKDGSLSAIYVSPPPNIAFPKMNPSSSTRTPKDAKPGDSKQ